MGIRNYTRRDFLKTGALAAASTLIISWPEKLIALQNSRTKVILIRNKNVVDQSGKVDSQILARMFDEAVQNLFNANNAAQAWKKIINPKDVVGIKTNVWNYLRTPIELEVIIKNRVLDVGVKNANISINDRGILRDPVFKRATALINTRPMRTHYWSGVGSLIKNYIMFVPSPADYHPDSCADLAAIWNLPHVKGKTRLNILVMLTPQFHSVGPHGFSSEYVWNYGGLIVGVDPVACDAVGLKILEEKRKLFFGEDKPLNPPAKHIMLADTRHHLGTADLNKIDLVKLGWDEERLI